MTRTGLTTPSGGPVIVAEADLRLEIERPGEAPVTARIHGSGSRLTMEVDQPGAFAGADDSSSLRGIAEGLASVGVSVRVESRGQHLVTVGATRAPWWHRRVTGSRRIRLGSVGGVITAARARTQRTASILPSPACSRRARCGLSSPPCSCRPGVPWAPPTPPTAPAVPASSSRGTTRSVTSARRRTGCGETTVIGSDPDCDVVLAGLEPRHAIIDHAEGDEYVVTASGGDTRVHGAGALGQVLRTGARLDLGDHTLVFYREEYADHGRPFGGRIGGELGHQLPQPSREELQARSEDPPA